MNLGTYCILSALPFILASNQGVIMKNIGQINFYEKTWIHTFDLNLESYINNAILLQNVTNELMLACKTIPNDLKCQYFEKNIERNAAMAQKDIDLLLHHRNKRNFGAALKSFGSSAIKQALISVGIIAVSEMIHGNEMDTIKEELEKQKKTIIALHELNNLRNNLSITANDEAHKLYNHMKNISISNENKENLDTLLDLAKEALSEHYQETTKYMRIINNELRKYFFNIIEMDTFVTTIRNIDLQLNPNAKLPTLNPYKLLDSSHLSYTNNFTHVSLHVKMPITSNITYTLYEFIPIPIKNGNQLKILKMSSKLYFKDKNGSTKIMHPHIYQQCNQIDDHMFCDSILHESLDPPNECMTSIFNGYTEGCTFRKIEFRNYFIRISPNAIFCFIVHPIQFRVVCNNVEKIHNLSQSTEIDFSTQCDLHKVLNELHYSNKTTSEIEISNSIPIPKFSIFDKAKNEWATDFEFFNESNATLTNVLSKTDEINDSLNEKPPNSFFANLIRFPGKIFSHIINIISYIFSNTFLFIVIYFAVLLLIVFICHKCFKRFFSFQE